MSLPTVVRKIIADCRLILIHLFQLLPRLQDSN